MKEVIRSLDEKIVEIKQRRNKAKDIKTGLQKEMSDINAQLDLIDAELTDYQQAVDKLKVP